MSPMDRIINAHKMYYDLFAAPHRSPAEQMAAADEFNREMLPVMPRQDNEEKFWLWLGHEARAVLEVDGAL